VYKNQSFVLTFFFTPVKKKYIYFKKHVNFYFTMAKIIYSICLYSHVVKLVTNTY